MPASRSLIVAVSLAFVAWSSCGAPTNNLPSQPPGQAGTVQLWSEISETAPCPSGSGTGTSSSQCTGSVTFTVASNGQYSINGQNKGTVAANELGNITQLANLVVSGGALQGSYTCPGGANPNAVGQPTTRTLALASSQGSTPVIVYQTDVSGNTCYRGATGEAKNESGLEVYFYSLLNRYVGASTS